ncbi:hypothetical protein DTO280E4_659 [Paecilomyces variotii]|nr:hypothetical protein DTO280E4_659 [Paecilomyces variotii]
MHWHGISQSAAPWSDGTPQASQWPISPHHFFDYEVRPKIGEAGSYYYHSHVGFQSDTVAGVLIVEEADGLPPYEYYEDRVLFLSELFNVTDQAAMDFLQGPFVSYKWPGEAESILVNGNGYRARDGEDSLVSKPYGKFDPGVLRPCRPEVIEVEQSKVYRFRAIGGVAMSPLAFAFEDHDNLTIINVDGAYTEPANTSLIQLGGGQRYDFLLETKSEQELKALGRTKFWIQIETRYRNLNNTFYAILSYKTDLGPNVNSTIPAEPPAEKPVFIPYALEDWLEYKLQPLKPNGFPTADQVTRQVYLTSTQLVVKSGAFWTVNNHTWTENDQHEHGDPYNDTAPSADVPYLVDIYRRGQSAIPNYDLAVQKYGGWDPGLNVYPARRGEVIDIILINNNNNRSGGFDTHPWHIHGDHIYDLGSGPGEYNATANEEKLTGYTPIKRDTSLLYKYITGDGVGTNTEYTPQGWRAWRLKVDNPGVWMIHCHVLQHMIMGMQALWVMGNATEVTHNTGPSLVEGYLNYGGNAYGNSSYDPLVNHYFSD